ncbi:MAG TPA: transglycosylase SLT domain-containing protein [Patescibacteria group bacterium]|nr:transglycosylase SLT domain-containing protein [Patescibacteria group bacterium]
MPETGSLAVADRIGKGARVKLNYETGAMRGVDIARKEGAGVLERWVRALGRNRGARKGYEPKTIFNQPTEKTDYTGEAIRGINAGKAILTEVGESIGNDADKLAQGAQQFGENALNAASGVQQFTKDNALPFVAAGGIGLGMLSGAGNADRSTMVGLPDVPAAHMMRTVENDAVSLINKLPQVADDADKEVQAKLDAAAGAVGKVMTPDPSSLSSIPEVGKLSEFKPADKPQPVLTPLETPPQVAPVESAGIAQQAVVDQGPPPVETPPTVPLKPVDGGLKPSEAVPASPREAVISDMVKGLSQKEIGDFDLSVKQEMATRERDVTGAITSYDRLITDSAQDADVSKVIIGLLGLESKYDAQADSGEDAKGIAMLTVEAAREEGLKVDLANGVDERMDPEKAVPAAVRRIKERFVSVVGKLDENPNALLYAAAAYKAGIGNLMEYMNVYHIAHEGGDLGTPTPENYAKYREFAGRVSIAKVLSDPGVQAIMRDKADAVFTPRLVGEYLQYAAQQAKSTN